MRTGRAMMCTAVLLESDGQAWELQRPGGVVGILNASKILNNGSVTAWLHISRQC